jgi:hypothetical protein
MFSFLSQPRSFPNHWSQDPTLLLPASSTSLRDPSKPSFLSLPGEIRNKIYDLIIYPHHHSLLIAFHNGPHDIFRSFLRSSLYRINRQVRAEAFSFLCSQKTFRIINAVSGETFLRYIGPIGRQSMTSITFVLTCFVNMTPLQEDHFFRFLRSLKHMRHFFLEVDAHMTDNKLDSYKWNFIVRMKEVISTLDNCTFSWMMIMRLVVDDDQWRLGAMFTRLEGILGEVNRKGGRAFMPDGTEVKSTATLLPWQT